MGQSWYLLVVLCTKRGENGFLHTFFEHFIRHTACDSHTRHISPWSPITVTIYEVSYGSEPPQPNPYHITMGGAKHPHKIAEWVGGD